MIVIRRRTQYLLARARQRKHTVEGLLIALANIDEIIRIIRTCGTQPEAKTRLMGIECPAAMTELRWASVVSPLSDRTWRVGRITP